MIPSGVPDLPEILEPYPVVADIEFAEGPIFDTHGYLYFVNYLKKGTLGRRAPDGTVEVWVHVGGQANGSKVDRDGNIVVADYGGKRILRIHPVTRAIEVVTDHYEGKPYLGPNDVCQDLNGNIFFSDPTGSTRDNPIGAVYRIERGTNRVMRVDEGLAFPNGLAVSPDQKKFYLAESETNRLLEYRLNADGTLVERRIAMQFETETLDGIMFDEYGRLWIARFGSGTVDVVWPEEGKLVRRIPAGGKKPSNLCWWGTDLYVTVSDAHCIHRFEVGCRAAQQIPNR
jgi:gluconolactonase